MIDGANTMNLCGVAGMRMNLLTTIAAWTRIRKEVHNTIDLDRLVLTNYRLSNLQYDFMSFHLTESVPDCYIRLNTREEIMPLLIYRMKRSVDLIHCLIVTDKIIPKISNAFFPEPLTVIHQVFGEDIAERVLEALAKI
ncbi:hypothetical protein [Adonisia turfae]|uniref:Uncharacterized protein n=1 Tax=Adonisia turfae CCMR0081 TaxID=2292702 RepID=A0A6M0RSI3_9CYAN|nr:hypothetical protein [Adonisia turfae]NEZ58681.1 hypothetical protein [Adonisia turfae CCMR0081]